MEAVEENHKPDLRKILKRCKPGCGARANIIIALLKRYPSDEIQELTGRIDTLDLGYSDDKRIVVPMTEILIRAFEEDTDLDMHSLEDLFIFEHLSEWGRIIEFGQLEKPLEEFESGMAGNLRMFMKRFGDWITAEKFKETLLRKSQSFAINELESIRAAHPEHKYMPTQTEFLETMQRLAENITTYTGEKPHDIIEEQTTLVKARIGAKVNKSTGIDEI